MITALDHVALVVRDIAAAADAYRRLLGVEPDAQDGGGAQRRWFRFPNMALELIAPDGEGPAGERVRAQLESHGEGVWALSFATPEPEAAARLLSRRGVRAAMMEVPSVRADPADTGGLQIFLRAAGDAPPSRATGEAPVAGLDHVVVQTANPDRALAVYGAKLGLDLRLDRENAQWGARQIFFKAGDTVVEIGARIGGAAEEKPDRADRFGGLAWRVTDADAAQARLAGEGFDVSEVRTGRKPGTRVFTVRSGVVAAPALMIQQNAGSE